MKSTSQTFQKLIRLKSIFLTVLFKSNSSSPEKLLFLNLTMIMIYIARFIFFRDSSSYRDSVESLRFYSLIHMFKSYQKETFLMPFYHFYFRSFGFDMQLFYRVGLPVTLRKPWKYFLIAVYLFK